MFWSRFLQKNQPEYKVFTTQYDVETTGAALTKELTDEEKEQWETLVAAYNKSTNTVRLKANLEILTKVDAFRKDSNFFPGETVVSILIDHSGSIKGQRAIIACLLGELVADTLSRLGVTYEILGFTTREWKGGESRFRWMSQGCRLNPGRLNDLFHIVYRDAQETMPGAPYDLTHLLRNSLLKENIDGEALLWAAERAERVGCSNKALIVISDGAPVDDSTLNENPPDYLWKHLNSVIKELTETRDFNLAAIGIDCDLAELYDHNLTVDGLDMLPQSLPDFLVPFLNNITTRPS